MRALRHNLRTYGCVTGVATLKYPDHYPEVLSEIRDGLSKLLDREAARDRNEEGKFTLSVASELRLLAVIGFLVERDPDLFRKSLVSSTRRRIILLERFDSGDPVPRSIASMRLYKASLDALASGHFEIAQELGARMGNRSSVEKEFDSPFEIAIGYSIKHILTGNDEVALNYIDDLEKICSSKDYRNFAGYSSALRGIVASDLPAVEAAIEELLKGHRRLSMGRGLFADSVDQHLSVWGVGIINLAAYRNLSVAVKDPLVPTPLLVSR